MATTPNMVRAIGNEAATTLSAPMSNSVLVFTGNDGSDFSASGGFVILDEGISGKEEVIYCSSKSGSTFTVADDGRGLADTSAVSHDTGATVTDIIVTDHINGPRTAFLVGHLDSGAHAASLALTTPTLTNPTVSTGTFTSPALTTPTLLLANTSPTANGGLGFDQTNKTLKIGDGINSNSIHVGTWTSWTPTLTNLTIGNGTITGSYTDVGGLIHYRLRIVLGSTSSVSGTVQFTLPVTAAANYQNRQPHGWANLNDAGVANYQGMVSACNSAPTTKGEFTVSMTNSTYLADAVLSSTVPFTFGTSDELYGEGKYERA